MGFSLGKAVSHATGGIMGSSLGGLDSIGGMLNDITGVTASSNQAFAQSKYLANMSYRQQKEFAQNAHQWEMADLAKAGLNPALTTQSASAGSIASEGQVGNSGYTGTNAGISPLSILEAVNSTRTTSASTQQMKAGAELQRAQATAIIMNLDVDHETKLQLLKNLKLEGEQTKSKTWRNYNEALGFEESESSTYSNSDGENRGMSFGLTGVSHNKGNTNSATRSTSHSRKW